MLVRMSNPLLTDKAMGLGNLDQQDKTSRWAPPSGAPINDGPISQWDGGLMTVSGTASATIMLLVLVLASATFTWVSIADPIPGAAVAIPFGWVIGGMIVGLISVLIASFKPRVSRIAGPIYALAQGVVVGAISRAYSEAYNGIVVQAVGATIGVFVVMLLLYHSRIIKVTNRTRRIVMGMMLGLMAFYLVSFVFSMFGSSPSFISGGGPIGILFSVFVAGLAAFSLALDFDMIEKGVANKMPAYMEWYCALGVTVTLVWLYLEILRLLSKLREN